MAGIVKAGRLLVGGSGSYAVAPPEVVQDTGNQTTTAATSDTATFASTTVSGRGVIVCFALKSGRRVSTLTDNKGNTYIRVGYAVDESDAVVEMWYAQSITGGASHTLTVTYDAAANCVWGAIEVSRIKGGGGFLDAQAVRTNVRNNVGSSASVAVTSGTPRSTNELFVAMLSLAGGGADAGIDTPASWTAITQFNNFDGIHAGNGAYRVNGNATALTATWTNDTTDAPSAMIIAPFRAQNAISAGVSAPVNTVAPAITGTAQVGLTLTASTGTWSNSPDAYTYQWKDDGVAISGATASTYVLTSSELGGVITVTVTAVNEGGSASATSAGTAAVTGDQYLSNVVLLLSGDGTDGATTTTDESPTTPHTITFNGNAQIDTAQKKFGTGSYLFDGTGDYLSIPDNADFRLTTVFTVELFIRFNSVAGCSFISKWISTLGLNEWTFNYSSPNLTWWLYRSNVATQVSGAWSPSANTWYHLCADRDSNGHTRVYVDGAMIAKNTTITGTLNSATTTVNIGRQSDGTVAFNGWIDEVRVTKGVARYASDGGFTVPTTAYPRS